MSLTFTSLNSGSNGNCYYIGNENEAILVDAGISCREIERRMLRLGLLMKKVKAVFVSHEHTDHIRGLNTLAKKHLIPVYITPETQRLSRLNIEHSPVISFDALEPVRIGELLVTGFPKAHDAADPYSFVIRHKEVTVGVFTDIGVVCEQLIAHFKQCHAAILEANYDEELLESGNYPYFLKKRIRGGKGHLSNNQALTLFNEHRPAFMSHLLLGHLSKNNNCPLRVAELFDAHKGAVEVVIASRLEETPLYHIG